MKRGIITNNEQGIHISDGEIWMTSWEIADLYYTLIPQHYYKIFFLST